MKSQFMNNKILFIKHSTIKIYIYKKTGGMLLDFPINITKLTPRYAPQSFHLTDVSVD